MVVPIAGEAPSVSVCVCVRFLSLVLYQLAGLPGSDIFPHKNLFVCLSVFVFVLAQLLR